MMPIMLTSKEVWVMRGSYISGDMIGRVTILAEINMRGAEMKVQTTIPVAIWRGKQQLQL